MIAVATIWLPMATTGTQPKCEAAEPSCPPEEQEIIDLLERSLGRKLTEQEIYLGLEQARFVACL
jgi:hypothetical protein